MAETKIPNTSTNNTVGKKSINSSAKRKNNNANNSYKVKSAKATKPDKDGF